MEGPWDLRREGYVSGFKYIGFKDLPLYIGRENPAGSVRGHPRLCRAGRSFHLFTYSVNRSMPCQPLPYWQYAQNEGQMFVQMRSEKQACKAYSIDSGAIPDFMKR